MFVILKRTHLLVLRRFGSQKELLLTLKLELSYKAQRRKEINNIWIVDAQDTWLMTTHGFKPSTCWR